MGEHWLRLRARVIRLRLVRHPRARRFVMRLCPDGAAKVTVPRGGSLDQAHRFVRQHQAWLERQLLRQATTPRRDPWRTGTEILFRGELVRIVVEPLAFPAPPFDSRRCRSEGIGREEERSRLRQGDAKLTTESEGRESDLADSPQEHGHTGRISGLVRFGVETLRVADVESDLRNDVESHLWQVASRELPPRVFELAALHWLAVRCVMVRNQRSRWGSCSRKGTISLNWRLIQTPPFVRDYIVLHELAHLKEMNHSKRFWREVERLCPAFAQAEQWLSQHGRLLL